MKVNKEQLKSRIMMELMKHVGKNNIISMSELHLRVFGEVANNIINDTRQIRKIVEELRREGLPICSLKGKNNAGYYIASAGSELKDYCDRIRRQALRQLAIEAKLRKMTLPQLLGEIRLNLESVEVADE